MFLHTTERTKTAMDLIRRTAWQIIWFRSIYWTIVNKKDTIFKYLFWERLDFLPIPE